MQDADLFIDIDIHVSGKYTQEYIFIMTRYCNNFHCYSSLLRIKLDSSPSLFVFLVFVP